MIRVHPPIRMAGIKLQREPEPPRGPPSLQGSVLAPDMAVQLPSDQAPRKATGLSRGSTTGWTCDSCLQPSRLSCRERDSQAQGIAPRSGHIDNVNLCPLPELLEAPVAADTSSSYGAASSGQWAGSSQRRGHGVHLSHALSLAVAWLTAQRLLSNELSVQALNEPSLPPGTHSRPGYWAFLPSPWLTLLSKPVLSLTELSPKRNLPTSATSWIIIRIKGVGITHTNFENLRCCCDHSWTWWVFFFFILSRFYIPWVKSLHIIWNNIWCTVSVQQITQLIL